MSDRGVAIERLNWLSAWVGADLTPTQKAMYVDRLASLSTADLMHATKVLMDKLPSGCRRMPSIRDIENAVTEYHNQSWSRVKRVESKTPIEDATRDRSYVGACMRVIKEAAAGQTTEQLQASFRQLHEQYPGHGWDIAASRLTKQSSGGAA